MTVSAQSPPSSTTGTPAEPPTGPAAQRRRGSTGLFTDRYELTMLQAAIADGTVGRSCVFEVFARRLPAGRRYGVVAGTGRLVDAIVDFTFGEDELASLRPFLDPATLEYLAAYRFDGDIDGYPEGELYFPGSPVLAITGSFGTAVILETLALSILNHDCAIASAAARMSSAAGDRPLIEMGTRRTHEESAVAASRAAYLAGFSATSNLEAGRRFGIPTAGTAAHAFTLLHDSEAAAFASQVATLGVGTTLLVDTYDITAGIETAVRVAGPELGAVRIDSGDLAVLTRAARRQLDDLGATGTKIVLSGDLDEFAIAALRALSLIQHLTLPTIA
jgi:nicotinate phosphoribosyltransferase